MTTPDPQHLSDGPAPTGGDPRPGGDYDELPYEGGIFAVTHPDHLAALGRLFGVPAVDPRKARMLEIGCSVGTNILPMAAGLPEAELVGMDRSPVQVAIGEARRVQLGLGNLSLRVADILEIDDSWGDFDYIICHGVYSWVPAPVRAAILRVCHDRLRPNGVSYLSYNVMPGWHAMLGVRAVLRAHTDGLGSARERVDQARAFLAWLADLEPQSQDPWHFALRAAHADLRGREDSYLLHEYLAPVNEPCTFVELLSAAREVGLQYLAEADLPTMIPANCGDKAREVLDQINGQAQSEEYMDLLRGRRFRQTLLVRDHHQLNRSLRGRSLAGFRFLPRFTRVEDPEVRGQLVVRADNEAEMTLRDPLLQRAFLALDESLPRCPSVEALSVAAGAPPGDEVAEEALADAMIAAVSRGFVDICAGPRARVPAPGQRPLTWPLARAWLAWGAAVPSQLHRSVLPSPLGRVVLRAADGTRDIDELLEVLLEALRSGELELYLSAPEPITDPDARRDELREVVELQVAELTRLGLLCPPGPNVAV